MSRRLGRSRRWGSQRGSAAPPTLFEQVLALSAGRPVFTADKYVVDGVSGRVRSFVDWNDPAHVLTQTVSANQVLVPAPHADFAGALCGSFIAAAGTSYVGNVPGAVDFMHDGSGGEVFMVGTPTSAVAAAAIATRPNSGRGLMFYHTGGNLTIYVVTAANAVVLQPVVPSDTAGVPTYVDFAFSLAETPDAAARRRGSLAVSQDVAVAPESGPSAIPLTLGGAGGLFADLRWTAAAFFPVLTPAQRTTVQQWIQAAYGIAP